MKKLKKLSIALLVFILFVSIDSQACTGIRLIANDRGVVYGRTMEWGAFDLNSRVAIIPRKYKFTSLTPDGKNGKTYKTKYGIVGLDILGKDFISDGMNEKGLAVGLFYHPGFAEYPKYNKEDAEDCISSQELANYILGSFKTIEEVKIGMKKIKVVGVVEMAIRNIIQAHWMVTDQSGESIVIEYIKGELRIHEAPLGVITNAPTYDWHITNLSNYINLSPFPAKSKTLGGIKISPTGVGSGMLVLPGDNTPPSRFVRAVAWTQTARKTDTAKETIYEAFRILDNFDLPLGPDGAEGATADNTDIMRSSTIWTTAWNLQDLTLNYHTQNNRRVRRVDLKKIKFDFDHKIIKHIAMDDKKEEDIKDKTGEIK